MQNAHAWIQNFKILLSLPRPQSFMRQIVNPVGFYYNIVIVTYLLTYLLTYLTYSGNPVLRVSYLTRIFYV